MDSPPGNYTGQGPNLPLKRRRTENRVCGSAHYAAAVGKDMSYKESPQQNSVKLQSEQTQFMVYTEEEKKLTHMLRI